MRTFSILSFRVMLILLGLGLQLRAQDADDRGSTHLSIQVKDEDGRPISGVPVRVGGLGRWVAEPVEVPVPVTGVDGRSRVELPFMRTIATEVSLPGFQFVEFGRRRPHELPMDARWTVDVGLRLMRSVSPQPRIHVVRWMDLAPPVGEVWGFDMLRMDWTAPHGRGSIADILVSYDVQFAHEDGRYRVDVVARLEFPGDGNGLLRVSKNSGEVLFGEGRSVVYPRLAPESGYEPTVEFRRTGFLPLEPDIRRKWRVGSEQGDLYFVRFRRLAPGPDGRSEDAHYGIMEQGFELELRPAGLAPNASRSVPSAVRFSYNIGGRPGRNLEQDNGRLATYNRADFRVTEFATSVPRRERPEWPQQQQIWWEEILEVTGVWVGDGPPPVQRPRPGRPASTLPATSHTPDAADGT